MQIKEFDSNGLIFILNHESSQVPEHGFNDYSKAVSNILRSQGFSCIPMVNGPRIRNNTNDLVSRPTYKPGGGDITGFVRLGLSWEEELIFFDQDEVPHLDESSSIACAVSKLFQQNPDGRFPLMVSIGGTPSQPHAIFTEQQLLSARTKAELFRQFTWFVGLDSDENTNSLQLINDFYLNISNRPYAETKQKLSDFSLRIRDFCEQLDASNPQNVLETVFYRSSPKNSNQRFGALVAGDIMQHACVGIQWITGLGKINEQPIENRYARELLCKANDFSYLAVYEGSARLLPYVIGRKWDVERRVNFVEPNDLISHVVQRKMLQEKEFIAIIKPDPKTITGEGPMMWPAIITEQELRSHFSLLNAFAVASAIETKLKELIHQLGLHSHIENKKKSFHDEWNWSGFATLGNVISVFRHKPNSEKLSGVIKDYDFSTMLSRLEMVRQLRNTIGHEALKSIDDPDFQIRGVKTSHFIALYDLRRQLF